jgi:3-hydroxyisobutyrate dehydrogenase
MERKVAVLGTGIMGAPLARNLLRAGFAVRVWNRTSAKAEALAPLGGVVCATPAEAARGADFVLTMLADGAVTEEAMLGSGGALAAMDPEAVWVQMGTMGRAACLRMERLAAQQGVRFVDAPVVGTQAPAERRELVILAAGTEEAVAECGPVFSALARRTLWVGPAGYGQSLKLVVNKWILDIFESLAEAVAMAEGLGVEPRDFLFALEDGPVGVPSARVRGEAMMARRFPHTSFSVDMAHKDAMLILDAAREKGCEIPLTEVAERQLARTMELGSGEADLASVILSLARHHEGAGHE